MSRYIDDGGAAFPWGSDGFTAGGLSMRDWFAGQALAGKMSIDTIEYLSPDDIAARCYKQADAMLKARKGGEA